MDTFFLIYAVISLVAIFVYAFFVYESLRIVIAWGQARWRDDWGKSPLVLRLPPKLLTGLLVLCFLAMVL